jgi:hypothetical protein
LSTFSTGGSMNYDQSRRRAELYNSLMKEKRLEIGTLLGGVTAGLRL